MGMPLWVRLWEALRRRRCIECRTVLPEGADDSFCSDECYETFQDNRVM